MKIVDRYLLREHLVPFAYCLFAFCMLFVTYDLFDRLSRFLNAQVPLQKMALYYALLLAPSLEYLVPASLLLATLYSLWQLSRHNELTAMRASGVSLYRIMLPFLGVGLLCTLLVGMLKETIAPHALLWTEQMYDSRFQEQTARVRRDLAYYNSLHHRVWLIESLNLNDPHVLHGVKLTQERADGTRAREIRAARAEYLDGQWWFYGAQVQRYDARDNPVGGPDPPEPDPRKAVLEDHLRETPHDMISEFRDWEYLSSLRMFRYLRTHPELSPEARARKAYDLHSRLAAPWACLIVTLFGIPAGAKTSRQSVVSGILLALLCFFGFYALMQTGIFLGKRQILWPWLAAWLSNIVFLGAGLGMLARMR